MAGTKEDIPTLNSQTEPNKTPINRDTRGVLVSRVFEALQRSLSFVITKTISHANRKRKRSDDGSITGRSPKKSKTNLNSESSDSGGENDCSICLEPWSVRGDHRITSLKCGHIFGRSCIMKWIQRCHNCPHCCASAEIEDMRYLFVQKIRAEDNSQQDIVLKLLEQERAAMADLKKQLAIQTADNKALKDELAQLKMPAKHGYFSAVSRLSTTLTAIGNCLCRHFFTAVSARHTIIQPHIGMLVSGAQCNPDKRLMADDDAEVVDTEVVDVEEVRQEMNLTERS